MLGASFILQAFDQGAVCTSLALAWHTPQQAVLWLCNPTLGQEDSALMVSELISRGAHDAGQRPRAPLSLAHMARGGAGLMLVQPQTRRRLALVQRPPLWHQAARLA